MNLSRFGGGFTSSSRIDTCDFTEGRSDADDADTDSQPSPDDGDRPAADQRVVQSGGQTVRDGGEDEGHEGDLEGRSVAAQLGLVAQVGQGIVGIVVDDSWQLIELGVGFG